MQLGYVIVYVEDVPATIAFYQRAFGVTPRFVHESNQYAEMDTGHTALAFAHEALPTSHQIPFRPNRAQNKEAAAVEIAFIVPDVSEAYQTAIAHGATPMMPPTAQPWGQIISYVRDLNGILVELCTAVSP